MATQSFRVCPACGSRNKPKWEACARCGELLTGVGISQSAEPSKPRPVGVRPPRDAVTPNSTFTPLTLGMFAVGALLFAQFWGHEPAVPAPGAFTIPTQPAAPTPVASPPAPRPADSANFVRGRLLLERGEAAEAARVLADAVTEAPNEPLYRSYYAKALWLLGSREQALGQYDAAVRLNPASVDYRTDRATAYMALGRRDEAESEFGRVLDTQPGDVQALRALARLKLADGDNASSVALLTRAAQARGSDPEVVQDLAYAYEKSGNYDQARTYYADVLAKVPDAQITRSRLAETLLAQSRPDEAAKVLEEGITRTPTAPMLRRSLGSVLERSGRTQEAVAAYRDYVRLAPNAEDAKTLAARADGLERRLAAQASAPRAGGGSSGS
jgi:Flp pilus assembly protein TadD